MCTIVSLFCKVSSCILLFVAAGLDTPTVAPPQQRESGASAAKLTCEIWSSNDGHSHHQGQSSRREDVLKN